MKSILWRYIQFFLVASVAISLAASSMANQQDLLIQTKTALACVYKQLNKKQIEHLHAALSSVIDIAEQGDGTVNIQSLLTDITEQLAQLESADTEIV